MQRGDAFDCTVGPHALSVHMLTSQETAIGNELMVEGVVVRELLRTN